MKQPICKENLSNHTISIKQCKKYGINTILTTISLSKWNSTEGLIEAEFTAGRTRSSSFQSCSDKFIRCFSLVSIKLCGYPSIQTYASKLEHYLKTSSIKKGFEELYNSKSMEEKLKKNKQKMKQQARIINQYEAILEDQNSILELGSKLSGPVAPSTPDTICLPSILSARISASLPSASSANIETRDS